MTFASERLWTLSLALGLSLASAQAARAEVIERVSAVVNDRVVLLSELRRRAAPFLEQLVEKSADANERKARLKQLYERLLQGLIDEELVEQAAKKANGLIGDPLHIGHRSGISGAKKHSTQMLQDIGRGLQNAFTPSGQADG